MVSISTQNPIVHQGMQATAARCCTTISMISVTALTAIAGVAVGGVISSGASSGVDIALMAAGATVLVVTASVVAQRREHRASNANGAFNAALALSQ